MVGGIPGGSASAAGETKVGGGGNGSHRERAVWFSPDPSPEAVAEMSRCFPTVVTFPEEELSAEMTSWAAAGVVAKSFGRRFQPEALIREFRWRGRFKGDIKAFGLDRGYYLVKFALPEEREKVLGVPWVVNGQIVAVEPWRPAFVPVDGAISQAILWIRLPLLPVEYWGEAAIRRLVSEAGEFVGLDDCTAARNRLGFARASVKIDLGKPLRPGTLMMAGGKQLWQRFIYENLDDLCLQCGVLHPGGARCPASAGGDGTTGGAADLGTEGTGPRLGPWVLAVRRRQTVAGGGIDLRGKFEDPAKHRAATPAGEWQKPTRVARRPTPVNPLPVQTAGERRRERGLKDAAGVGNPFSALAKGGEEGSEGGRLGPSSLPKRARPNEVKESQTSVQPAHSNKFGSGRGKVRSRKLLLDHSKGKELAMGQEQSTPEAGRGADESGVFRFAASDKGGSGVAVACPTPCPEGGQSSGAQLVDPMLVSVQAIPRSPERGVLLRGGHSDEREPQDASRGSPVLAHDMAVSRLRQAIQGGGEGPPAGREAVFDGDDEVIMSGDEAAGQLPHLAST